MVARVLRVSGLEAAVFDRDASPDARAQGGMLDIHEGSGQAALRAAGLLDEFRARTLSGGEATRVLDRHGRAHFEQEDDGSGGRPEIDRGDLRCLLVNALPTGAVRWSAQVLGARPLGDGGHEVALADGSVFTTDVLVGADGAWSRIRPLVSEAAPARCGISFVETDLFDAEVRHPGSAEVVGGGSLFALGAGRGLLAHRETDGSVHVCIALRTGEDWLAGVDLTDESAAKSALLEHFDGWHSSLRSLIADADGPLVPRPIHALPVGHSWDRVPGVTLLGDAAHLMSPFAGEGANIALHDAAELARCLVEHPDDVEGALAAYEADLFPRARSAAEHSPRGLDLLFNDEDPPQRLVAMFTGAE
jgi:2-polyprenyl-6-methoxyphenol hydroxylase-like FAD-dependent oxidoreductase